MSVTLRNSVIVAGILASIAAAALTFWLTYSKESEVCRTKECINAASRILNSMNQTADPCNDFYQYACGGWIKNHPIPDDKSSVNNPALVGDRNRRVMKDILSLNYTNDREAIKKLKIFYRSCMDEDSINAQGAKPALDMIKKFGGMPLFGDAFDERSFRLEMLLVQTKTSSSPRYARNVDPFVVIGVGADDKNSSDYVIYLDQPGLGLPDRNYYLDAELRNSSMPAYRQFMHDYLAALWEAKERDNMNKSSDIEEKINSAVEEIIKLETDLAEILATKEERKDVIKIYNKMSLQEMSNIVSSEFNWFKFVEGIMSKVDIEIQSTTEVIVYGKPYLTKLMSVLNKYENRIIKNYVLWIKLQSNVFLLSKKFRDTEIPFRKEIFGTSVERPRFHTCISRSNNKLPMPVAALYVKERFSEKNKEVMDSMSTNIIQAFKNSLSNLSWMDDETKKNAEIKANNVGQLIGYPDYIVNENDPKLDDDLMKLSVSVERHFENFQNANEVQLRRSLMKVLKPVKRDEWYIGPAVVNAFYDPNRNIIIFPAGVLQSPFHDAGKPFAMNYGAIGSIIGHELSHGFDDTGSKFDSIGNLKNWWGNTSRANFANKANCVRGQYGGFFLREAGMNVNGNSTLGENIADNAGIRQSYDGYQLWKKDNPNAEFALPGLEKFTPEQLFFLGNAQVWCNSNRRKYAILRIITDSHSPYMFRVEGPFMNFEKFGEAYNCKRGQDKLYPSPEDTCRVW